ncbi:MAG TPA: response regulator, partial [Gammaproteobacteria bacterium]|nr:response regulator [Gammaproteobacteria bacterium]
SQSIVEYLASEEWPDPLIKEVTPALVDLLNAPYLAESDATQEERQAQATAEDVSLQIPDDISAELLEGLLQELPMQTEGFSAAIQSLIDGSGDIKTLEKAQRIAHTVKGAGNTVGIRGIANLTHQLEDILILLNKHERMPSQALSTAMMNAADCLEEMSEALVEQTPAPDNAQEVLQHILDWINRLEKEGIEVLDKEAPVEQATAAAKPADGSEEEAAEEEKAVPTLRVPAPIIDDIIRILGETIILTTQLQENVRRSSHESEELANHNAMLQGIVAELERQVEMRGIIFNQKMAVNQSEVFDPLELEQYNELHTLTNQLTENVVDSFEMNRSVEYDLHELDELLFQQSRLHREVQELIMKTRMVPIKSITPRLQRSVRQTCRTTNKQVNLHLKGTDTLIDSDVLSGLLDPLMHMLRNAIDHGIESRDERIRKQKSPEGRIDLEFSREGTMIVVRCRDDGAGLNQEAIRLSAIKKGLVDPGEELDEHDINRLILLPGFSTRQETTQVSGRGIGMDVVNSQIQSIKGSIHIESEKDRGCLFELRLPITLISSHSILIRHRDQILAVSNHGIIQILHPSDSEIMESEDQLRCRFGEEILDAVNLEDLIDMPGDRRAKPRETRPALLIEDGDDRKIVFMQEIMDVRELVIKHMGNYLKDIKGITGATILGDGSVVPVLDIPELIRNQGKFRHTLTGQFTQTDIRESLPLALVVDDSLSARRSLAQVIKDAGYDVRTAKDGLEALEIIKKKRPDIMLVDLEMPRMNGMELSSHIRADSETSDIPIIMVTSRSTEKHRKEADNAGVNVYLTKPFNEDEMLDHVSTLLN